MMFNFCEILYPGDKADKNLISFNGQKSWLLSLFMAPSGIINTTTQSPYKEL